MIKKNNDNSIPNHLLDVQEAADYLGVHTGTVRRWAYANRLKGTKIGVRGDWRFREEDLINLTSSDQAYIEERTSSSPVTTNANVSDMAENTHFVQFYEDDAYLINAIKDFINSGDAAVVVMTQEHKVRLEDGLEMHGLDLVKARTQGNYIYLDAKETLSKFMVDNTPDPELFFEVIGGLITRVARNKHNIKIFGEMVAILWAEGNQKAAVELEVLWNELQKIHSFSLFCAYPMNGFGSKDHGDLFENIGKTHSHVFPAESYSTLMDEDKRLREIALLQQKAQALEAEITKHKTTEGKLRKTVEKLKELEQRREDFLSATSHELKTPLTSQKVFIQLLQNQVAKNNDNKYSRYLTKIHEQTEKLTKLVTDLLDVSKVHGGKLVLKLGVFDINKCIAESVEEIQAIADKHTIYIKGKVTGEVYGDKDKISQVIINLLTNAVKYSPKGKKITVNVKNDEKNVTISVKDNGIGIDRKKQGMVFERFYRVSDSDERTYPGLGMGLYIAWEIVKQHGGKMSVDSIKGKGSTFSFTIPSK